jgi:DNA-binding NarL/FixJ family response regulator
MLRKPMPADDPRPEPLRVIAVDDQAPFLEAARNVVAATAGFAWAGQAESGADGLRLARECDPDIVIMDIRMPDMDGIEAARRLVGEWPQLLVLLVSVEPLVSSAELLRSRAVAFSRKHEFKPAVLRLLEVHRDARSSSAISP